MTEHDRKLWEATKDIYYMHRELQKAAGITEDTQYGCDVRLNSLLIAIARRNLQVFAEKIEYIRSGKPLYPLSKYSCERQYDKLTDDEFSRMVAACSECGLSEFVMFFLRDRQERGQTTTGGELWL